MYICTENYWKQIDLLIDRNDGVINLCEMKYTNAEYVLDMEEDQRLRQRIATFVHETKTRTYVSWVQFHLGKGNVPKYP